MDTDAFVKYLKKSGKKDHVIQGLIRQVERFEEYLHKECGGGLEDAQVQDFQAFTRDLEGKKPGSARVNIRGLALYYHYCGFQELSDFIFASREIAITQNRKIPILKEFQGVDEDVLARLKAEGIVNTEQMLSAGQTPSLRAELAMKARVPEQAIVELVKLSDLARLPGVKGIRARLYLDAGVDTVEKLANWEAEPLRLMVADFVKRTGFQGIPPLPKEVSSTIESAKKLPLIVEY